MAGIFKLLEQQHLQIRRLLDQLDDAPGEVAVDEQGRQHLLDRLVVLSSRHEAAEEMVFWPAVRRRLDDGERLSQAGIHQETDAKYLIDAVRFETSEAALTAALREISVLVRKHADFEEQEVWPLLRKVAGPLGRAIMGRQFALALRAVPTRPHPSGPDHPAGLATAGLAAAIADKMRDAVSSRPVAPPGGTGTEEGPEVTEFLIAEHARIDALLSRAERDAEHDTGHELLIGAHSDGTRRGCPDPENTARIVKELSVHDSIEREHLYPVLRRRLPDGNALYPAWLVEHGNVAAVLSEIDRRPDHDPHRQTLLGELVTMVRTHFAEEEGTLFPAMRVRMTLDERLTLGRALADGKHRAPTRPHSHIAGAGFGAKVSRLVAAPVDRTRDVLAGRP